MPARGLVAGRPPNVRHDAPHTTAPKLLGLVTLWDGSANHECALPLWCQQAHRLAAKIPPPWRTQLVVMAPKSSGECNASYVWSNDTARANRAYLDRTPIEGSWSYLKHCTLLKWGVFALSHLDLVLYADVDVDLDPTRFEFHGSLLRPYFRASIGAFLQSGALIVSDPDHASPINTGLFLAKPARWVHAAGLSCMRSCNFSKDTGFDEAGEPRKLFGNHSHRLWQQLEVRSTPCRPASPPVCAKPTVEPESEPQHPLSPGGHWLFARLREKGAPKHGDVEAEHLVLCGGKPRARCAAPRRASLRHAALRRIASGRLTRASP